MITKNAGTRLDLLDTLEKGAVCAELGVLKGDFSREVLTRCKPFQFYMVDLFQGMVDSGDADGKNFQDVDMGKMFTELINGFVVQHPCVTIVKSDASEWLKRQRRGSLDWIYLDASHQFLETVNELAAAHFAVKNGGMICGHDYSEKCFDGVVRAVNGFASAIDSDIALWTGDGLWSYAIVNKWQ